MGFCFEVRGPRLLRGARPIGGGEGIEGKHGDLLTYILLSRQPAALRYCPDIKCPKIDLFVGATSETWPGSLQGKEKLTVRVGSQLARAPAVY